MLLKKIIFPLLIVSASCTFAEPTSRLGKFGAGIVQVVHKHPFVTTAFPYAAGALAYFKHSQRNSNLLPLTLFGAAWIGTAILARAGTETIMIQCDIDPLDE